MSERGAGRSKILTTVVAVILLCIGTLGGVAIAMLGGAISGVNLATGLASAQAQPCQTSPVNFTFVQPQWSSSSRAFNIQQVTFKDFDASCVNAGARLSVVVTEGNTTFLETSLIPSGSTGTIDLSTPLNSNRAPRAEINYLVQN